MRKRFLRICFYTFSMYVATHIVVFILLPFVLLISFFSKKAMPIIKRRFVKILFFLVGKKPEVHGLENLEKGKAYLIIPNYPSFYASFALIGVFPDASIVANAFTAKIPLLGHFLKQMDTIFVDPKRIRSTMLAIDKGLKVNKGRNNVLIFPEGQRTPDGQIHAFKRGFTYFLRNSTLNLLPVTLNGFYQMKPMKRFYFDPDSNPQILLHKPISNSEVKQLSDTDLMTKAESIIAGSYKP